MEFLDAIETQMISNRLPLARLGAIGNAVPSDSCHPSI